MPQLVYEVAQFETEMRLALVSRINPADFLILRDPMLSEGSHRRVLKPDLSGSLDKIWYLARRRFLEHRIGMHVDDARICGNQSRIYRYQTCV